MVCCHTLQISFVSLLPEQKYLVFFFLYKLPKYFTRLDDSIRQSEIFCDYRSLVVLSVSKCF